MPLSLDSLCHGPDADRVLQRSARTWRTAVERGRSLTRFPPSAFNLKGALSRVPALPDKIPKDCNAIDGYSRWTNTGSSCPLRSKTERRQRITLRKRHCTTCTLTEEGSFSTWEGNANNGIALLVLGWAYVLSASLIKLPYGLPADRSLDDVEPFPLGPWSFPLEHLLGAECAMPVCGYPCTLPNLDAAAWTGTRQSSMDAPQSGLTLGPPFSTMRVADVELEIRQHVACTHVWRYDYWAWTLGGRDSGFDPHGENGSGLSSPRSPSPEATKEEDDSVVSDIEIIHEASIRATKAVFWWCCTRVEEGFGGDIVPRRGCGRDEAVKSAESVHRVDSDGIHKWLASIAQEPIPEGPI